MDYFRKGYPCFWEGGGSYSNDLTRADQEVPELVIKNSALGGNLDGSIG